MDSGPQYRGVICQSALEGARRSPHAEAILERVSPTSIEAVDACLPSSWLPTGPYDDLAEAVLAVGGLEGVRAFFEQQIDRWYESKLFGPMLSAGRRIFAPTPLAQLKWYGWGWQATTRGMGTTEIVAGDGGVQVTTAGLPPSHRIPRMVAAMEGSIRGVVLLEGHEPAINVDDTRLVHGTVTYDVR